MGSKAKAEPTNTKNTLNLVTSETDRDKVIAQTALRPSVKGAVTIQQWSKKLGDLELTKLVEELSSQSTLASQGKLGRGEAMLMTQAHTLDAIFNELARRAALNMSEYLDACETYLRLALKAQSQCRATIETLAEIKNPHPVAFVKQANIANNQQVNNGTQPAGELMEQNAQARAGARENQIQSNELLEGGNHGNWLEQTTTGTGITGDSSLAALGQGDRAEIP